jgi:hypothetical protein
VRMQRLQVREEEVLVVQARVLVLLAPEQVKALAEVLVPELEPHRVVRSLWPSVRMEWVLASAQAAEARATNPAMTSRDAHRVARDQETTLRHEELEQRVEQLAPVLHPRQE